MANYIADNGFNIGHPDHDFVGWDDLGGEAVEATNPGNLGVQMGNTMEMKFRDMKPGQTLTVDSGFRLFRM